MHSTEKVHDTTLDDKRYNVCNIIDCCIDSTAVLKKCAVLCNEPEAFTSNLGDDQPRYLLLSSLLTNYTAVTSLLAVVCILN